MDIPPPIVFFQEYSVLIPAKNKKIFQADSSEVVCTRRGNIYLQREEFQLERHREREYDECPYRHKNVEKCVEVVSLAYKERTE